MLAFQFISGLASGTFIPLTIGFVVQNLPGYVLAYIDGFMVLGFAVIGALLLMLLLRVAAPGVIPFQSAN